MKRKVISIIMGIALFAMAMTGCGSSQETTTEGTAVESTEQEAATEGTEAGDSGQTAEANADGKALKIGYYGIDTTQAFFKDVYDGLQKACDERGWELNAQFTNYDPVKMRSAYDQFKAMGVDIIIDGNAMQDIILPFAQEAANDGIPYLGLHVDLPEPAYTYGTANTDMGKAVGEFIGQQVKDEWRAKTDLILHLCTFTTGPEITERLTSAVPALGEYVSDVDYVKQIKIDADAGDTQAVYQQVSDALSANPGKKIVMFCQPDDMANAEFYAVEAAVRSADVMGTGSDCSAVATDYFKAAIDSQNTTAPWRGSIYLGAINYGEALCDLCEKITAGEEVPYVNTLVPEVVGINNLYDVFPELK